jgi:hypothetical protein
MKFLLVMIIATALSGCVKVYPKINPAKPVEYVVIVRGDRAWQDSHVHVRAGQVIKCKAEGQWSDHFNSYGPEGNPDIYKTHFGTNAPANSLIMRISSQTNMTYFIGSQASIVAERSGEIRFRKNYSLPIGMEGEIKVKVMVCSDADGDGISDYDEINLWKTNPLSLDSDGDAFTDLEEITDKQQKSGLDDTIKQDEPAP